MFKTHESHTTEVASNFWEEYLGLLTDPAHLLFEATFTILFDGVIIALLYGLLFKKYILPRWRAKVEKQFHKDHGLDPENCDLP